MHLLSAHAFALLAIAFCFGVHAQITPAHAPNFELLFVGTVLQSGTDDLTQGPFGTRVHVPTYG